MSLQFCSLHGPFVGLGCPVCASNIPGQVYTLPPQPRGCICPPTSEQTCQSLCCPRKSAANPQEKLD
jgi:hypothetical protein